MANATENVTWTGISGTNYQFQLHPIGVTYLARGGVYIFCRNNIAWYWDPVYIGESDSFLRRLTEQLTAHHKFLDIRAAGATHISTLHVPGGLAERLRIETDLRHAYQTPCNDQ